MKILELYPTKISYIDIKRTSLTIGRKFEILKSLPKYNSHCHLGGEIPMKTLLKHANIEQKLALRKPCQK